MAFSKNIILFSIFSFVLINVNSQPLQFDQHKTDSLLQLLQFEKNDTGKIQKLIILAQMYIGKGDSALIMKYANDAFDFSNKINYSTGKIESMGQKAFYHAITGDWPKSILEIYEVLPLCENKSARWYTFLCNLMFINVVARDDLNEAKIWALKANAASGFQLMDDFDKWPTYVQLGLSYEWANQLDSATYYAEILKGYLAKYNHLDLQNNSYTLLGNIARKQMKYEAAISYYRLGNNSIGLAMVYDNQNKIDSAIYYALAAFNEAQPRKNFIIVLESTKILARLYSVINPKLSNKYLQIYMDTKDAVFNTNKLKALEEINLNEQKRQFEISSKEAAIRNSFIQFSLAGLALLFLISTLFIFRNNRIRRAANNKLEKAYIELQSTQKQLIQSEKMASLGELTAGIAHEIQNPLNFVNNFSEVSAEMMQELKEYLKVGKLSDAMELAEELIGNLTKINHHGGRAAGIVKSMLEHSKVSDGKRHSIDINALCKQYAQLSYNSMIAKNKSFSCEIELKTDTNAVNMDVISEDIGRVFQNVIINAFYAVEEKVKQQKESAIAYMPKVILNTNMLYKPDGSKDGMEIRIKDNGIGMSESVKAKIFQPFFTTKPTGRFTGLGLSISYDIVTKGHQGAFLVESYLGEGTEMIIRLPFNNKI